MLLGILNIIVGAAVLLCAFNDFGAFAFYSFGGGWLLGQGIGQLITAE